MSGIEKSLFISKTIPVNLKRLDNQYTDHTTLPKEDVILLNYGLQGHSDLQAIIMMAKKAKWLACNRATRDRLKMVTALDNGYSMETERNRRKAMPAYDTTPSRDRHRPWDWGNGYILKIGRRWS